MVHLDTLRGGLSLDADFTKNRKSAFQPLPASLVQELETLVTNRPADAPLLAVPHIPSEAIAEDYGTAEIERKNLAGRADFHSLRVTFVSLVLEHGASAKEAMTLARHSTANLTMNTYAKARDERLSEIAESLQSAIEIGPKRATSVQIENEPFGDLPEVAQPVLVGTTPHENGVGFDSPLSHHRTWDLKIGELSAVSHSDRCYFSRRMAIGYRNLCPLPACTAASTTMTRSNVRSPIQSM